jgi:Flp pilus assembly protein TadD
MHTLGDHRLAQPFALPEADDERALYMRGLLALRNGDAEEAASLLTRALRWQPI